MSDPTTPPAPAAAGSGSTRRFWAFLLAVTVVLVGVDQVSKFLAVKHLTSTFSDVYAESFPQQLEAWVERTHLVSRAKPPQVVVKQFWSWRYAENPGSAWSFAANWPENVRMPFFQAVSVLAILLIGYYFAKLRADQWLLRVALALVMGGAIGNFVDRLLRGYVIDFIDWHWNDPYWTNVGLHWPTFNVADMGITVGVALIALDSVFEWRDQRRAAKTANATQAGG